MKKILLAFFALSSLLISKEVTVSITPQKFFVEKIAGDKINVNVMVKPGASPATYEPKVSQMKKLANSEIYFSIGVPFENAWLEKFENANKNMKIVDTSEGIKKLEMEAHSHHEHEEHLSKHEEEGHNHHDHGPEGHEHKEEAHEHSGLDPHIWLEPTLVKNQAKIIYRELVKLDKENEEFYKKNLKKFLIELETLDQNIKTILEKYEHKAFMVFHPSWGYFAKKYHLEQIAIEIEGKEPKPSQLIELIDEAKKHDIKVVFVAPQFSKKGANTISKSIKANVVTIDPLALNWDENLLKVANEIANSYK
ncbi:metal ABC transporter solute-binding protein, Zn/Mn family [Halarcobacter bivalviorum]|uniref:Cation ABC transporter substrate-binding protein n=1 Tax=Halarcobacter bivalviorum TaxID=663364 RepID=A0AAX2A6F5_9BACT|nr:zinc ABC transporter substrate-binding protein [Halarcobacter bivalviorum]AXH12850.1 metal ion ABC transporter, periplasmic metal-binding protein [Halarcobacter bivalviorum]RXK09025.1 cation ABC transporter substrate-binding protein [Halarcobacter bivalviorum]